MNLTKNKIEQLYQYYAHNGFDHTVDEIASALTISKKTFFNRYNNKNESIVQCVDYWHELISNRFQGKLLQCNHSVEELVLFSWELQTIRKQEHYFFNYEIENETLLTGDAPYMSILQSIIRKGIRCYHFNNDIDILLYSKYLISILAQMSFTESEHPQIMRYLLDCLLTERGKELLEEMNI